MLSFVLLHATESAQEFKAGKHILYKVKFMDKYKRAGVNQHCKANVCILQSHYLMELDVLPWKVITS